MSESAKKQPAIPRHRIDEDALKVVRRLQQHEHQAYLVGGCVRDLLLGATPKDFDVATSATPNQVKRLFRNCRIIGRRFRLAHIIFKGRKIIETATFRSMPKQKEGAEGEEMIIWQDNEFGTAEEDANRRDFRINGLFYDPVAGEVIDYVGGVADVEKRVIQTIGDPKIRLQEDPVRIIRALKFSARLDLDISPTTKKAMVEFRGLIASCSVARVLEEIYRILASGKGEPAFQLMHRYGVLAVLFPELNAILPLPRSLKAREAVPALRHKEDRWWAPDRDDGQGKGKELSEQGVLDHHQRLLKELIEGLLGEGEATWRAAGRTLFPQLEQLDRLSIEREQPPSHSFLLAVLLSPLARRLLDEPVPFHDIQLQLDELVQTISSRLCISRRDRQQLRHILSSQVRMTRPGRRSRPRTLIRCDFFPDALALLKLRSEGSGLHEPSVERWTSLCEGEPVEPSRHKPRKRRRRRRRRRPSTDNDNKQG